MHHDYKTQMTCSQMISYDLDGDVVSNISFLGGCNGSSDSENNARARGRTPGTRQSWLRPITTLYGFQIQVEICTKSAPETPHKRTLTQVLPVLGKFPDL